LSWKEQNKQTNGDTNETRRREKNGTATAKQRGKKKRRKQGAVVRPWRTRSHEKGGGE